MAVTQTLLEELLLDEFVESNIKIEKKSYNYNDHIAKFKVSALIGSEERLQKIVQKISGKSGWDIEVNPLYLSPDFDTEDGQK